MKRKLKMKERLEVFLLAVLFLLQTIMSLLPAREVRAGVNAIEVWDAEQILDYKYRFNMKFQPGITKVETFGCDNYDKEAFTNHGRSGRDVDTKRMTADYVPGSAGIRYYNVGTDGHGNIVDVRMSVVNVVNPEPRYDMQTVIMKRDEAQGNGDSSGGYAWEDNIGLPMVAFTRNGIGMYIYCVDSVKVNLQFLKHNTEEPLPISGHGTVRDLDAQQGVYIPENSRLDHAYMLLGNDFLIVDGLRVTAPNLGIDTDDPRGWLNILYDTDNFDFGFTHDTQLKRWDDYRDEGIAKQGSVENWKVFMRNRYKDAEGNSLCPNFDGGKIMRGHAFFDFTAYCFGGIDMSRPPEKRVGAIGCTWENAVPSGKDHPFLIKENDEFQYMIQTEVTPNDFDFFMVRDTLADCITLSERNDFSVFDENGENVTEQFDIRIDGQTVTCFAKPESLSEESFSNNRVYTIILPVHRNMDADTSAFAAPDGYSILVPNSAQMSYQRVNETAGTLSAEPIWVRGVIPPELVVEKSAPKYEWKVGETIDYTVNVTQIKENTKAVQVVIEDVLPAGFELLEGGISAENTSGGATCTITEMRADKWTVVCPELKYAETITVHFRCLALEAANGQESTNIVTVTAENLIDPGSGEPESEKDMAEVWLNSPRIEIDKNADKYEWQAGDEVCYRIVVNNAAPGTIAREVQILDFELPKGLVLSGGTQSVEIADMPKQVEYPVPDKKTGQTYETRPVEAEIVGDETGFAFYCSYLPYSSPVTLLCHCTAQETSVGYESVNIASASAENAEEVWDDSEIFVNTGDFRIEKTADHYEWQLGELVEYTVVVENTIPGTIARNVTVWDNTMPEGLALASPDSVSVSGIPGTITQPVAGTPDVPNMLNPEFYGETAQKPVSYAFMPDGTGWRLEISDLPAGVPAAISFLCTVTEEVNGMESVNMAQVQAENAPVQTDDAEIYVNTAVLTIEENVNNPYLAIGDGREVNEFRVGEQVNYQVTVDNLQKGSIARDVVISSLSLPEGLALDGAEDAVTVYGVPQTILNPVAGVDDAGRLLRMSTYNEVEEKYVECQVVRQGTGWIVTISDLPYHTPVTVDFRCNVQESVNGLEVTDTAQASAANADTVTDSRKVWINSPVLAVSKEADKPSYKYGDIITYRVKLAQVQTGCVARNVTLNDVIETPGMTLLKDTIVFLDEKGNMMDAAVEAGSDNSFTVTTGRTLIKDARYSVYDGAQGGAVEQVLFNPLDVQAEKEMTVEYRAAVTDSALAGQTVHNTATVNSMENIPSAGESTVEINSPVLDLVKEADKKEYRIGEKGYYKLTVRQLREDVTAENIVIEDALNYPGAVLLMDSILIKKNGVKLDDAVTETLENGFRITAGTGLGDKDKLEIHYIVEFVSAPEDGSTVVNTAKAWGNGMQEVFNENEVFVNGEVPEVTPTPEPTEIPEPTVTPTPTKTPMPTGTPVPTAAPRPTATPVPRPTTGTCPRLSPAPTKAPLINNNNNGNSGTPSNGSYSGGSYGNYQSGYSGGYQTGGAKTGDARPFHKMAWVGICGVVLLAGGLLLYRRAKKTGGRG